jgi:hypothetical protein
MRIALLAVALMFALMACASPEKPQEEGSQSQELMLQYAQCMRDNGVQLPDPVDGQVGTMYEGVDQESPAFVQADEACSPILQGIIEERTQQQDGEQQEDLLALAQCLRDHGIDVADPVPGAEQPFGDSLDRTDPATAQALEECTTS